MKEIAAPDKSRLESVQKICDLADPYLEPQGYEKLFASAMREIVEWHARGSEFYRKMLQSGGFDPSSIRSFGNLSEIPLVPANFFKSHEVLSIPRSDVAMRFTSSGTSGQKSQMFFDGWSLASGQRMVDFTFEAAGWSTEETPQNYLLYSYETEPDTNLGTAYTDNYLCKFAPANRTFVAIRRNGRGGHDFDAFGAIEKIREFEKDGAPVRIFGFPSFLFFTLQRMRDLRVDSVKFPKDSLVILGGGWKGNANQQVSKAELYARIHEQLGIPEERIRDSFGAVEHGVPYFECEKHQFHVPVWSSVLIRDFRTLKPVGFGERGFLQFLTPFITSVPAHSLMMGDVATLHPGSECGCGITRPYFVVHGRAGTSKNRSCAVAASELLGRVGS